jgi:hypothetical protein
VPSAISDPFPPLQTKPPMVQQKERQIIEQKEVQIGQKKEEQMPHQKEIKISQSKMGETNLQMPKEEIQAEELSTAKKYRSRNIPKKLLIQKGDKTSSIIESVIGTNAQQFKGQQNIRSSEGVKIVKNTNDQARGEEMQIHFGSFPAVELPRKQAITQKELVKETSGFPKPAKSSQTAMATNELPKVEHKIKFPANAHETSATSEQDSNDQTESSEPGINVVPTITRDTISQSSHSKISLESPSKDSKNGMGEEDQEMHEKQVSKLGKKNFRKSHNSLYTKLTKTIRNYFGLRESNFSINYK